MDCIRIPQKSLCNNKVLEKVSPLKLTGKNSDINKRSLNVLNKTIIFMLNFGFQKHATLNQALESKITLLKFERPAFFSVTVETSRRLCSFTGGSVKEFRLQ